METNDHQVIQFILLCVRHGETDYNQRKMLQGCIDISLNERGRNQAQEAGKAIMGTEVLTRVISSDLSRARETAEILLTQNTTAVVPEIRLSVLCRERGFGEAEGRLIADFSREAHAIGMNPDLYTPPGGETTEALAKRVESFFLLEICADAVQNETVLVVSHGRFLKELFFHFIRRGLILDDKEKEEFKTIASKKLSNTAISKFEVILDAKTKFPSSVRCVYSHRNSHLK